MVNISHNTGFSIVFILFFMMQCQAGSPSHWSTNLLRNLYSTMQSWTIPASIWRPFLRRQNTGNTLLEGKYNRNQVIGRFRITKFRAIQQPLNMVAVHFQSKMFQDDVNLNNSVLVAELKPTSQSGLPTRMPWKEDGPFLFDRYLTLQEVYAYMDHLQYFDSSVAKIETIGNTFEGRPIKIIRLTAPSEGPKPIFWIDAGTHGREWISVSTSLYLVDQMMTRWKEDPVIKKMLSQFEWYILPVLNPDGYSYTWSKDRMWRKNRSKEARSICKGVDLNRNYDFHFSGPGSSSDPCHEKYQGSHPFSEAETKAVQALTEKLRSNLKVFISLHSYQQLWLVPFGSTKEKPKDYQSLISMANVVVDIIQKSHGTTYRTGTIADLAGLVSGSSIDWAHYFLEVIYAFAVELPDKGSHGFLLPPDRIVPTGQEMMTAIQTIVDIIVNEKSHTP